MLGNSQTTSTDERVRTRKETKEVVFSQKDAKIILEDLLKYEFSDSIIRQYSEINGLNLTIIKSQNDIIGKLTEKNANAETKVLNLTTMIGNKEDELAYINDVVDKQEKEIKRQKRKKNFAILGGTGATIAAVVVAVLLTK